MNGFNHLEFFTLQIDLMKHACQYCSSYIHIISVVQLLGKTRSTSRALKVSEVWGLGVGSYENISKEDKFLDDPGKKCNTYLATSLCRR